MLSSCSDNNKILITGNIAHILEYLFNSALPVRQAQEAKSGQVREKGKRDICGIQRVVSHNYYNDVSRFGRRPEDCTEYLPSYWESGTI